MALAYPSRRSHYDSWGYCSLWKRATDNFERKKTNSKYSIHQKVIIVIHTKNKFPELTEFSTQLKSYFGLYFIRCIDNSKVIALHVATNVVQLKSEEEICGH